MNVGVTVTAHRTPASSALSRGRWLHCAAAEPRQSTFTTVSIVGCVINFGAGRIGVDPELCLMD